MSINMKIAISAVILVVVALLFATLLSNTNLSSPENTDLTHDKKWGIYSLDLQTQQTNLIYSSDDTISRIRLNNARTTLVFSQKISSGKNCTTEGSPVNTCEEICSIQVDGKDFKRITNNDQWDLLPCWSADDSSIFFLSFRETLDIYRMDADGGNVIEVYDSGFQDSDLHSSAGKLAFTRNSQIWIINEEGTGLAQVTDPPRAGEWGDAVLPFGDYDPCLNSDGTRILFERMVDDETSHGIYEIYEINIDGSSEVALTETRYTQGIACWSHSDQTIVYMVSAIGNEGKYDLYMMNSDGSENKNITPDYFAADFLCHDPIFSADDSKIFFVGEWYSD